MNDTTITVAQWIEDLESGKYRQYEVEVTKEAE